MTRDERVDIGDSPLMPTLEQRLQLLMTAGLAAEVRADALVAALEHADDVERGPIAAAMLAMGTPRSRMAAARHLLSCRGAEPAAALGAALGEVSAAAARKTIAEMLREGDLRMQLAAADVARMRCDVALLQPLARLVDGSRDELPARAASAVLETIEHHLGPRGGGRVPGNARQLIDLAAADLLRRAREHRQTDALLAVALAVRRAGTPLREMLEDDSNTNLLALRRAIGQLEHPTVTRNMISWLAVPAFDRSPLRWLHRIRGSERFSELLSGGHLLLHPVRRRAMRNVDRPMRCLPDPAEAVRIDERLQHRLPDLATVLPISAAMRVQHLRHGVALPSPLARLRCAIALEGAAALNVTGAASTLEQFLFDRDSAVATAAAWRRLSTAADEGAIMPDVLAHIERRAAGGIGQEASQRLAGSDPAHLLERVERLTLTGSLAAARACLQRDGQATIAEFASGLERGERGWRLRLIAIIQRLRLAATCAEQLLRCTKNGDAHVAAAAVTALQAIDVDGVRERLRECAEHENARVRASAVESLAALAHRDHARDQTDSALYETFADAESNRLRANAIRAMIDRGERGGCERLHAMLRDPRPLHRVSALWLAQRVRAPGIEPIVRRLAQEDASAEIRRRAVRVARFVEAKATMQIANPHENEAVMQ